MLAKLSTRYNQLIAYFFLNLFLLSGLGGWAMNGGDTPRYTVATDYAHRGIQLQLIMHVIQAQHHFH